MKSRHFICCMIVFSKIFLSVMVLLPLFSETSFPEEEKIDASKEILFLALNNLDNINVELGVVSEKYTSNIGKLDALRVIAARGDINAALQVVRSVVYMYSLQVSQGRPTPKSIGIMIDQIEYSITELADIQGRLLTMIDEIQDPNLKAMVQPAVTNTANSITALKDFLGNFKTKDYLPVEG